MSQSDTKTRILDSAEQLFARDGFHAASLRTLTEQAGVNLAAVNYHFGTKEGLIQAVFARRLLPLDTNRRQKLEAVLAEAAAAQRPPGTRELLQAFIEPVLDFRRSEPGAKNFLTLIGRSLSEPDDTVRTYFIRQVMPAFTLLFNGLQQALPQLPANILMTRLQFTIGAMGHMMCHHTPAEPLDTLLPPPLPPDQMLTQLLSFATAGLESTC